MTQFIKAFPTTLSYVQDALTSEKILKLKEVIDQTEDENAPVNPDVWDCDALSTYPFNNKHLDKFIATEFIKYITDYLDHEHNLLPPINLAVVSWHNKYTKTQYQEAHNHIGPMVIGCGVYVLEQEENTSCRIQFLDPNKDNKNACGIADIKETPEFKPNDLILFPPYLQHKVLKQDQDSQRTTVSFNISIKL